MASQLKSREEVIQSIRAVSSRLGGGPLSTMQFLRESGLTITHITKYFGIWGNACEEAGVEPDRSRDRYPDNEILADWGLLVRKLGSPPAIATYRMQSERKISRNAFNRFGLWKEVPHAFIKQFSDAPEWADVLEICRESVQPKEPVVRRRLAKRESTTIVHEKIMGRSAFGEPVLFRGILNAPLNEQGVVFLFGMVAEELNYRVQKVQIEFPDCTALRKNRNGSWDTVRIEFEHCSRTFVDHLHNPDECDVIVCWKDNWPDKPAGLEVIELSTVINNLKPT